MINVNTGCHWHIKAVFNADWREGKDSHMKEHLS